eukprot:GFYU01018608.1.p1 GENE.GFYU01018608.1~~GFYU01018608.1.p1  ORF type:complete len:679 (-),score=239.66 GFYU01018608.1:163-2199(-)
MPGEHTIKGICVGEAYGNQKQQMLKTSCEAKAGDDTLYSVEMTVDNKVTSLTIRDTTGVEDNDSKRKSLYSGVDFAIVCVAIANEETLERAADKWIPEIRKNAPKASIVICGTGMEQRASGVMYGVQTIPLDMGLELAAESKAFKYHEVSTNAPSTIRALFEECVLAVRGTETKAPSMLENRKSRLMSKGQTFLSRKSIMPKTEEADDSTKSAVNAALNASMNTSVTAAAKSEPSEFEIFHFKIGSFKCASIMDGSTTLPRSEVFAGVEDEKISEALQSSRSEIRTWFNCLVVDTNRELILIDCGASKSYGGGKLMTNLAAAGYDVNKFTHVVLTHGHHDTVNATVDHKTGKPQFPNAKYVISEEEWNFLTSDKFDVAELRIPDTTKSSMKAAIADNLKPLKDAVQTVKDGESIADGIKVQVLGGHTIGNMVVQIRSDGESLYAIGDVIYHELVPLHPDWMSAYHARPAVSSMKMRSMFEQIVAERAFVHSYRLPFPGTGKIEHVAAAPAPPQVPGANVQNSASPRNDAPRWQWLRAPDCAGCKLTFQVFDVDNSGKLSVEELAFCLRGQGLNPTEKEMEGIIATVDINKNGVLEIGEFCSLVFEQMKRHLTKEDIIDCFRTMDLNGDGFVSVDELHRTLTQQGDRLSESQVQEMIAQVDIDNDGKLNYDELCSLLML